MNCNDCQRLSDECDRLEELRDKAQAVLKSAARIVSLPEYLAAHAGFNNAQTELALAQNELEEHLRLQHGNTMGS